MNQSKVQFTRSTAIWSTMSTFDQTLQERKVCNVGEQMGHRSHSTRINLAEQTLNTRPLTLVSSDGENDCLTYTPCAKEVDDQRNLCRQALAYANPIGEIFRRVTADFE